LIGRGKGLGLLEFQVLIVVVQIVEGREGLNLERVKLPVIRVLASWLVIGVQKVEVGALMLGLSGKYEGVGIER